MSSAAEASLGGLRAGAAEVKITPPVGVDLSGYAAREGPTTGVHDDLWCRAVVLDGGGTRLGLVALDLLGLDFAIDAAIRRQVAEDTGLPPKHLLLNCSHTHAGPAVAELRALGSPNRAYVEQLPAWVAEAVAQAMARAAPASLSFGTSPAGVGVNRRERTADDRITIGVSPQGITDEQVRVMPLVGAGGEPVAVLFSYACHGTTLGAENRQVSADWMGAACEQLRGRLDGRALPVFLQGCCGQINPRRERRTMAQVAHLGAEMAEAVVEATGVARPVRADRLAAGLTRIQLPLQDPPDLQSARADLARAEAELAGAQGRDEHAYALRALEELASYSRGLVALAERGARGLKLTFAVQAMAIGELALVGLSGEVFLEFARQIEAASPFPHTVVLGYTNGCTGYVPTAEAIAEGGYEPEGSFRYYGTLPLAPQAGDEMTGAALALLQELRPPAA